MDEYRERAKKLLADINEKLENFSINQLMNLIDDLEEMKMPIPKHLTISVGYSDGTADWIGDFEDIDSAMAALENIKYMFNKYK